MVSCHADFVLFASISALSAKFILWKCGFISAFSSQYPLSLLQFIKSQICLQLYGLDEQPGSIQNFFLRRETSLTGLECEGGGKSFPLVLLNIID